MVGSRDSILWDRTPDELGFAPETPEDSSDLTAGGGEHYGAHENGPIKEEMVEWVDEDLAVSEDNDKSREDTQSPVFPGVHVILNEAPPGPARKKRKPQNYDDVQTSTRGDADYAAAAAAAAAVAFNSDPLTLVSKGLLLQQERNAKSPRSTSSPTEQQQQHQQQHHQQHPILLSEEEEDLFGRYVAATIKKFSGKSKSVAKMRIQHVLFEVEEAERLGKDCSLNISVTNGN